jgi:hypothetical protein
MEVGAGGSRFLSAEIGLVVISHNDMDAPFPKQGAVHFRWPNSFT